MHKKYSKFLMVSFVGLVIFAYYTYSDKDMKSEAASSMTSSLATSKTGDSVIDTSIDGSGGDKAAEDTAFLMKLSSLENIKIDSSLFSSQSFKNLKDNNIRLEPVPYGRVNPFAPTQKNITNNKPAFSLKTGAATSILDKSVTLSGTLEGTTSTNIYFEYGTTQALGKTTPKLNTSLVGNFSSNVTLLTPKTVYFYRAVANINGVLSFGDIMSFTTN